jgi:hypothetical protein
MTIGWLAVGIAAIMLVITTAASRWSRARERRGTYDGGGRSDPGFMGGRDDPGYCGDPDAGDACGDGGDGGGGDGGGDGGGGGD